MAIGFDFGTSNCSVAHVINDPVAGKRVETIPLSGNEALLLSAMCAPTRESVSEYLFSCLDIKPLSTVGENVLRRAIAENRAEGINVRPEDVLFGQQARDMYLEDPDFVYYVKSPKSFLGTLQLREAQLAMFEDIVCAMMANVKSRAEAYLGEEVTETVIGRPVNFNNRGGEASNIQAEGILHRAATRAGFKHIEFQFEPVAAGLDFESTLTTEQNVLVVDIGGGTSDCSMIRMGPQWLQKKDRSETLLAHAGRSIGGNNLDISIAFQRFMPEFGKDTQTVKGTTLPSMAFWNPVATNDVNAQRSFYAFDNLDVLKQLRIEARYPEKIDRLIQVYQKSLGHLVVGEAEKTKIALSDASQHTANLHLLNEVVDISVLVEEMEASINEPMRQIKGLIKDILEQSSEKPDVVYITGGSSRSPIVRNTVKTLLPDTPIVSGNYMGSVTEGLARWADLCFS
ncbi:molecular chaperone [Aliamphritea ceti]|uniref:molecular chaperone n=1 Tax=Aliamphritea ceti TaxID=1524258 RepID=UPI0021C468F3|nr:molecular chaperone [Aliamphritea ceti]